MKNLITFFVFFCIYSHASGYETINLQTKGNLEAPKPADCVDISQLKADQNPSDIFVGMKKCLSYEKYFLAAKMYFAAISYGLYDTKRVSDKTSHQGLIVLRMNTLAGLSEQKLSQLQSEIDAILANNGAVCSALAERGPPAYHPRYMIQHGIRAFSGKRTNDGLVDSFNSQSAWEEALAKAVKCH